MGPIVGPEGNNRRVTLYSSLSVVACASRYAARGCRLPSVGFVLSNWLGWMPSKRLWLLTSLVTRQTPIGAPTPATTPENTPRNQNIATS